MTKTKWIQKAFVSHKKGALHRQLGVSEDKSIGKQTLTKIKNMPLHRGRKVKGKTVTRLMKARAVAVLNANKRR